MSDMEQEREAENEVHNYTRPSSDLWNLGKSN